MLTAASKSLAAMIDLLPSWHPCGTTSQYL